MATYDDVIGLYCVLTAEAAPGGPWAGETAQVGIRLGIQQSTDLPDLNAGQVNLGNATVKDASVTRAHGSWNVQQGFVGGGGPGTLTDTMQDKVADAFGKWRTALATHFTNKYNLKSVALYPFAATSRTGYTSAFMRAAPSVYTPKTTTAMGSVSSMQAPESAAVVSFSTATRGRLGRGRIYVGALAPATDGNGLVADVLVQALGSATVTLLHDLRFSNQIGGVDAVPCLFPVVYNRPGGKTQQTGDKGSPINLVRVGNHWDVQRRRQRQVPETYARFTV